MLINNSLRLAVVALLLMLGAVACSGGNADNTETNDTARPTEQTDTGLRSTASNYEIEGPITSIVNSQSFFLGSTLVIHDSSTRFEYGNANDLAVGRRVEVEGSRASSGTITAREIEFEDGEYDDDYYHNNGDDDDNYYDDYYEIEGRITSIVDSQSFLLGSTLVIHNSSTRFEYGNANDLAVGRRVEVEGTRIGSATIIAREIEFEYD